MIYRNPTLGFALIFLSNSILGQSTSRKLSDGVSVVSTSIQFSGNSIGYTSYAGYFILKDESEHPEANIFFTYYQKNEAKETTDRPITFAFNGGPGSPSCWIHMGGIGPYKIALDDEGLAPSPPYSYKVNEQTWLAFTDMVFIDPIYTGFSRPYEGIDKNQFLGYENDIIYLAKFIEQFLNQYNLRSQPLFIAGESYGSIRAVGLTETLQNRHDIFPNGLMLISGLLDYGTLETSPGNDLPYIFRLPTLAATARYHGLIKTENSLKDFLAEVEHFSSTEYLSALFQGNGLSHSHKNDLTTKINAYTNISQNTLNENKSHLDIASICKSLFNDNSTTIGRLDTRIKGNQGKGHGYIDPSFSPSIKAPYMSVVTHYIKNKLKVDFGALKYDIISGRTYPWNFNSDNRYLNVTDNLSNVITTNPFIKVWVSGGYYDLATPYFASTYSLKHLNIDKEQWDNITQTWYEAGHMFYHDKNVASQFMKDAQHFYQIKQQ